MAGVTRKCSIVAKEPKIRNARGWGSNPFDVEAPLTLNDHDAANWRRAAKARESVRTRRKHKEPVPRKEGRLH